MDRLFAQLPEVRGAPEALTLGPERRNDAFEAPADTRSFAARPPALLRAALALLAGGFLAPRRRT